MSSMIRGDVQVRHCVAMYAIERDFPGLIVSLHWSLYRPDASFAHIRLVSMFIEDIGFGYEYTYSL